MAKTRSWNPVAFVPLQVSILGGLLYIALFAVLLVVHLNVPSAPSTPTPAKGINLTEAWLDLEFLSEAYHPWGSRRNEVVRNYLLQRVEEILDHNGAQHQTVYANDHGFVSQDGGEKLVAVFANDTSNFTSEDTWTKQPITLYGESSNLLVYIRGKEDKAGDWWNSTDKYDGTSGVLVNAHYDSVSSGFGATDDGVGVVTVLQLIAHFTQSGNQPRRGIVALLNNGEENGLYGAHSFVRHPLSQLPRTFLNLEGAGAGGRATLFRSTDAEVTKAYSKSRNPFGTVVSSDGFKRGFIRSGTDYTVFTEELNMRGLDVAFFEPRARYHTNQDSSRETSPASLWHMLSASLATMQELSSHQSNEFEGSHQGTSTFWYFDILGAVIAVGKMSTLFALSVTALVAGPIILILLEALLRRSDKWYILAGQRYLHSSDDDEAVRLHGRRGFFRFPLAFIAASGSVVLLAYLMTKVNPSVVYSSEYAVWATFLSAFFVIAWLLLAGAANVRPTALQRTFCILWIYILTWMFLVVSTVGEHNFQIASGYFLLIYNVSALLSLLISYLELFALPKQQIYVETVLGAQAEARPGSRSSRRRLNGETHEDAEPTERTSLLRDSNSRSNQQTFARLGRRRADRDEVPEETGVPLLDGAFLDEQAWSSSLPQWTWLLQLLLLAVNVVIVGQIALLMTSATHQTLADGNPALPIYLIQASLTILLLLPLVPFLHRFTYHVPTFLLLVFIGCLVYSLLAFPFSRESRMKYYFVQHMNLETGVNNVTLQGLDGFVQDVAAEMPSAAGQILDCGPSVLPRRAGLTSCCWHGLPPNVVPRGYAHAQKNSTLKHSYRSWLGVSVAHEGNSAVINLQGQNTKMCRIVFENPVSSVSITDAATDARQRPVGEAGSYEIRLFSRDWDKIFQVNVTWDGEKAKGQKGRAWCMWDDANTSGSIPAYDELHRFEPVWSVATKTSDGLLEGFKDFVV